MTPIEEPVAIRWYTSIDSDRDVSRPRGEDAMRLQLIICQQAARYLKTGAFTGLQRGERTSVRK